MTIVDGRRPTATVIGTAVLAASALSIALYVADATTPGAAYVHLGPCATAIFMVCFLCLMFQIQTDRKLAALIELLRKSDAIASASQQGAE